MPTEKHSRKAMHEKRRKNTKLFTILMILGVVFLIAFISIWLFGGGNNEAEEENSEQAQSEENQEESGNSADEEQAVEFNEIEENVDETEEAEETDEEVNTTEVEPSDGNVIRAFEGDWNPVGTEQEGNHTINFSEGSQDRIEMRHAILLATDLSETDYREWWVAGDGEQKVIATVSDAEETEIYRVYLSWQDGQGWQPTRVEQLKENEWRKYQ